MWRCLLQKVFGVLHIFRRERFYMCLRAHVATPTMNSPYRIPLVTPGDGWSDVEPDSSAYPSDSDEPRGAWC